MAVIQSADRVTKDSELQGIPIIGGKRGVGIEPCFILRCFFNQIRELSEESTHFSKPAPGWSKTPACVALKLQKLGFD